MGKERAGDHAHAKETTLEKVVAIKWKNHNRDRDM